MTGKTKPGQSRAARQVNKTTLRWIIGGVAVLALILLIAVLVAGEQPVDESIGYGDPTVEGDALPPPDLGTADAAIGMTAPTVDGADWEGNPVSIEPGANARLIVFLAHWCPHCQNEVPVVQQWVDEGNLPDNVELIGVVTATDRLRPNWPPQDWLIEEGWTEPVIMDDEIGTVAASYGMSGTPFWVVLDPDLRVLQRVAGEIGVSGIEALAAIAAASVEG